MLIRSCWLMACWVLLHHCWFSSHCFINCWERGIQVSNFSCRFVYFSFLYYQFLFHVFCSFFCFVHSHLGLLYLFGGLALLSLYNFPLSIVIYFALNSTLSDINIATPGFLWLMFVWYIYFCLFTFNLPMLLYLK